MKNFALVISTLSLGFSLNVHASQDEVCTDLIGNTDIIVEVGKSVKALNKVMGSVYKIEVDDLADTEDVKIYIQDPKEIQLKKDEVAGLNTKLESDLNKIKQLIECRIGQGSSKIIDSTEKILAEERIKSDKKSKENDFSKYLEFKKAYDLQAQFFALERILNASMEFCDTKAFDKSDAAMLSLENSAGSILFGYLKGDKSKINKAKKIDKLISNYKNSIGHLKDTIECVDKENEETDNMSEINLDDIVTDEKKAELKAQSEVVLKQAMQSYNLIGSNKKAQKLLKPKTVSAEHLEILKSAYFVLESHNFLVEELGSLKLQKVSPYRAFGSLESIDDESDEVEVEE